MSNYVKNNDEFVQGTPTFRECPHCGRHAQLIAVSTPSFAELDATRPEQVPLGYRCAACGETRFARARVRSFGADAIELSPNVVEVERAEERFAYNYLPENVARVFREALACHTADCHTAFALMCRATLRASNELSKSAHPGRLQRAFHDSVRIGAVDGVLARRLEGLLFGDEIPTAGLDEYASAVLVEIMKDMLYECHVREARLRAALRMRRYFADEAEARERLHEAETDKAAVA